MLSAYARLSKRRGRAERRRSRPSRAKRGPVPFRRSFSSVLAVSARYSAASGVRSKRRRMGASPSVSSLLRLLIHALASFLGAVAM